MRREVRETSSSQREDVASPCTTGFDRREAAAAVIIGAGRSLAIAVTLVAVLTGTAFATNQAPGWNIDAVAAPSAFSAERNAGCLENLGQPVGKCDSYQIYVTNAGSAPTQVSIPTVISGAVPGGLTVQKISLFWSGQRATELGLAESDLAGLAGCESASPKCTFPGPTLEGFGATTVGPDETLEMIVYVTVDDPSQVGSVLSTASVSGGGAEAASVSRENRIGAEDRAFGLENFNFAIDGPGGKFDGQAGDHPYEVTTTIDLKSRIDDSIIPPVVRSGQDVKDVVVDLPAGFAGSTLAAPECTFHELASRTRCPVNTQVGRIVSESAKAVEEVNSPIWNLVPENGTPAEFGFLDKDENPHVFSVRVVPSPDGYVLQVTSADVPQAVLYHIAVTFYGDPAARDASGNAELPFFTNPTDCSAGPPTAQIHIDSWQDPGRLTPEGTPDLSDPNWVSSESSAPTAITGCNELQFLPTLSAQPTTQAADSPSGLEFDMNVPQSEGVFSHATPALKDAVISLPAGMTVDPSAANGLSACSEAQIGWEGGSTFNFNLAQPACPDASKIGSLELTTPLIRGVLTGAIYLAAQNENPFGSTLGIYVVVNDSKTGVLLKIPGEIKSDEATGQLTTVVPNSPQLPFSDLKLHFFGGPRGTLATPNGCGTFTTTSNLTPWSAAGSKSIALRATPFDGFTVNSACVSGFAPSFVGGTTNLQAGAFTPFVASFSRSDTEQELQGVSVSLPPGLLAYVATVPECPDALASSGNCPEASRVGSVRAEAGPGPDPVAVQGEAYLTGPYNGGPYGLSVVVPAIAGPFNFGTVVVRQSLRINRHDAHVEDVSDPLPTILDPVGPNGQRNGVPIKVKRIDVSIDRPNFTFNPTSCNRLAVQGTLASNGGLSSTTSTPFQVANCVHLKFAPKFAVSTSGQSSKAAGASLTTTLSYPNAPQGTYADIAKVKVDLPKQLPSRLTTLQKACTSKQFETNPAGCPAASIIGHATVSTPLLPLPLSGPAYFVSDGNEAFPSLTVVLQGNGVTIELVGTTLIRNGVTSTTFNTVPDTPFSRFELTLPRGPFSALAANLPTKANGSFCGQNLKMPTLFVAQNGLEIHQQTPISIAGCAKKTPTRAQRLAAALKACKKKPRSARAKCATAARRKFAPAKKPKSKRRRK